MGAMRMMRPGLGVLAVLAVAVAGSPAAAQSALEQAGTQLPARRTTAGGSSLSVTGLHTAKQVAHHYPLSHQLGTQRNGVSCWNRVNPDVACQGPR